jgi:signal transduction histidine kinase
LASAPQLLQTASLHSLSGERQVQLPHLLLASDFAPQGSLVRYRIEWPLQEVPTEPQAVYVPKMSLSGRLFVNGALADSCGHGPLQELRCLHQSQLLHVPNSLLHPGLNTLEFEIHATARQMNGLSAVRAGDADTLYNDDYFWRQLLTVQLQRGLIWLSTLLGLLSLTVGMILTSERVFLWFGLTSLVNAVAALNGVVVHPPIPIDVYNWLMFASRLVSTPLGFLLLLAVFDKDGPRTRTVLLLYCTFTPVLIWWSGNNRMLTFALYAPLMVYCAFLFWRSTVWSWHARSAFKALVTLLLGVMFGSGIFDWLRLGGQTRFEGIYLSAYTYIGVMVTLGLVLLTRMASALRQSQRMSQLLEQTVTERIAYEVTEHIPIGTFTITCTAGQTWPRLSFMSRRFEQITGLKSQQTVGHTLRKAFAIVHPQDKAQMVRLYKQAFAHQRLFSGRTRILVKGQTRWINFESASRVRPDGSILWEGVLIDETEQVHARENAERNRNILQAHLLTESLQQEREKLLRDVHDGFGSQLASVRMMVEQGRIQPGQLAGYLQEISADLHLVVDTLSQSSISLAEAIHDLRYRVERRFSGSGIVFAWDLALAGMPALSSRVILQLLRIVQEALHNALRHAQARHINVAARYDHSTDRLHLSLSDDGVGMPSHPGHGRGLSNMRHRAREIGAHWQLVPCHPGTRMELQLDHPGSVNAADSAGAA